MWHGLTLDSMPSQAIPSAAAAVWQAVPWAAFATPEQHCLGATERLRVLLRRLYLAVVLIRLHSTFA